jgi:hypothetical protein
MNKYRCKECGSENLVWRGYMVWDFESQSFKKVEVDDEAFCDDCNTEGEPVKDELEDKDDLIELVIEQINNDQKNGDLEALYEFLNFVDRERMVKYLSEVLNDE